MTVLATLAHPVTVNHGRAGGTLDATKHLRALADTLLPLEEVAQDCPRGCRYQPQTPQRLVDDALRDRDRATR